MFILQLAPPGGGFVTAGPLPANQGPAVVQFRHRPGGPGVLPGHIGGGEDLGLGAEVHQPAEKDGAHLDPHRGGKGAVRPPGDKDVFAEPVQHHLRQPVIEADVQLPQGAVVHSKGVDAVLGKVQLHPAGGLLCGQGPLLLHPDPLHPVHPEVGDAVLGVVADEVVVVLPPGEGIGTDQVILAAAPGDLLPVRPVAEVAEGDLPLLGDGGVDGVHVEVDALVGGLGPAPDIDRALELLCQVAAGELLQLVDELFTFVPGDEPGGLDRVHQQL